MLQILIESCPRPLSTHCQRAGGGYSGPGRGGQDVSVRVAASSLASVVSLKFLTLFGVVKKQILRLTTPKLKSVWGPFRSG